MIIKKNRKKHYKIVLLAKTNLNTIKFLISKILIVANLSHNEFVLVNDVLKEYNDMENQSVKTPRTQYFIELLFHYKTVLPCCLECTKLQSYKDEESKLNNTINTNSGSHTLTRDKIINGQSIRIT